jgi:hypothetical protein
VIAGHHDAAVLGEAGENGEGGGAVEAIIRIGLRHMGIRGRIRGHFEIAVDAENLTDRDLHIGQVGHFGHGLGGGGGHQSSRAFRAVPKPGLSNVLIELAAWDATQRSRGKRAAEARRAT